VSYHTHLPSNITNILSSDAEAEAASKHPGSASSGPTSTKASDHRNEGFLKSAWHKLTHQHDGVDQEGKEKEKEKPKDEEQEPKKGAGSG
jgi:molecular chaperone DnaJ